MAGARRTIAAHRATQYNRFEIKAIVSCLPFSLRSRRPLWTTMPLSSARAAQVS